ncbi:MAG: phosphorylase, partial [Bacteroidota bacterium]
PQTRRDRVHLPPPQGRRVSVISTGIGTDNIDIILNELDALARVDLNTRKLLPVDQQRQLNFIRLGTSGCLQADLPIDSLLVSEYAIGLDGLMPFYDIDWPVSCQNLLNHLQAYLAAQGLNLPGSPYATYSDDGLLQHFLTDDNYRGITLTAAGFYGPQAREIRLRSKLGSHIMDALRRYSYRPNSSEVDSEIQITNLEMETAGIYALARALGHRAISISALLANRATGVFSKNGQQTVDHMIEWALERLVNVPLSSDD